MIQLVVYSVASFGLSFIVGHSKISLPFRTLVDPGEIRTFNDSLRAWFLMLLECPACLGFHSGLWFGFFIGIPGVMDPGWATGGVLALFWTATNLFLASVTGLTGGNEHE